MPAKRICLLFDLDGTLVDSLPDLTTAVNLLRRDLGFPPLEVAHVRGMVGDGAAKLVERALPGQTPEPGHLPRFLDHYRRHLTDQTLPYPGIVSVLEEFSAWPMAVVTNKPVELAVNILQKLELRHFFSVVVGGDSCREKKPHPLPLLSALKKLDGSARQAVMIGDHHTDLRAARAASCRSCFCTWGIGTTGGETPNWRVATPQDLAQVLRSAEQS